ncbi:hypothetical protein YC2023_065812 [Brassica napus]
MVKKITKRQPLREVLVLVKEICMTKSSGKNWISASAARLPASEETAGHMSSFGLKRVWCCCHHRTARAFGHSALP